MLIPESVRRVGKCVFCCCGDLGAVVFGEGASLRLLRVEAGAFARTQLRPRDVVFPRGTWVSGNAFDV